MGINNKSIEQINKIAKGNVKFAILYGKYGLNENEKSIYDIFNVFNIYEHYYSNYLNDISDGEIQTLGVIAFFNNINLNDLNTPLPMLRHINLKEEQFKSNIDKSHKSKLLNIYKDIIVRFNDKAFANYILKHVFIDNNNKYNILSFVIENYDYETIRCLNLLLCIFNSKDTISEVETAVNTSWENSKNKEGEKYFLKFLSKYYAFNPTHTLVYLKNYIYDQKEIPFDINKVTKSEFEKKERSCRNDNDIIKTLGRFAELKLNYFSDALDLLFLYFKKRPDLYMDFFLVAKNNFLVGLNYKKDDYNIQIKFLEKISEYSEKWTDTNISSLFIKLASQFLRFIFNPIEPTINKSVTMHTIQIKPTENCKKYRQLVWDGLGQLINNENHYIDVLNIILKHGNNTRIGKIEEIIKFDWENISKIIKPLNPKCKFEKPLITLNIINSFKSYNFINTSDLEIESDKKIYDIYNLLKLPSRSEELDYQKRHSLRNDKINEYIKNCELDDIKEIIEFCKYMHTSPVQDISVYRIASGLEYTLICIAKNKKICLLMY